MAKLVPILAIFALCLNLMSGLLISTGAAATLGIQPEVGGDQAVSDAEQQADTFRTGAPTGSTLFGMYNVLAGVLGTLASPVTALPTMLHQAGTPKPLTDMMKVILGVIYALGAVSFLRAYRLN
jgi:hypothetical protein